MTRWCWGVVLALAVPLAARAGEDEALKRAREAYARGDYDQALLDASEAVGADRKNVEAYVVRGNAFHARGEYDRAAADFGRAIDLDGRDAYLFFLRGYAHEGKGDHEAAIADYGQALTLA